jgi:hypothetical protein
MLEVTLVCLIWCCISIGAGLLLLGLVESKGPITTSNAKPLKVLIKILLIIFMVLSTGLASVIWLFCWSLGDFADGMVVFTLREVIPSPDGSYIAYITTADGGATTSVEDSYIPSVRLRDRAHPLQIQDGRIIPMYNILGGEIDDFIYSGNYQELKWQSGNRLLIQLPPDDYAGKTTWRGADILYPRPTMVRKSRRS